MACLWLAQNQTAGLAVVRQDYWTTGLEVPSSLLSGLVCDMHTNELPWGHLIIDLDGKTLSNNKWSNSLGQMLNDAMELEIEHNIVKFDSSPLPVIPKNAGFIYWSIICIRTGRLALLEIGTVNHSRWLTISNRSLPIWRSKHFLRGQNYQNLKEIV